MFDGSTPASPSLASALSAYGFVGAWETNVASGRSILDAGASGMMAGDPALAGQPLTLEEALARIHPEDRGWVFDQIARVRRTGGAIAIDFRVLTETGEVRWIRNCGHLIQTEAGLHGYGAYVDITDLHPDDDAPARPKLRLVPSRDPLEQAADHVLAARLAIDRTGQKGLRILVDSLLLEVGRALARRQGP